MSHIFDALQRSEAGQAEVDPSSPSQVTELLQHAERRAASRWEETVLVGRDKEAEQSVSDSLFGTAEDMPDPASEVKRLADAKLAGLSQDFSSKFQFLEASLDAQNRLVCLTDKESPAAEAFHLLGVRLRHLRRDRPLKTVLITSTIPQEGKSIIAANLACALARRAPQKTLLIEGDLRRPSISQIFGIRAESGLSELLKGASSLSHTIYRIKEAELCIMPAGSASGNALEILQRGALSHVMDQLTAWFDWIIIDSPPMLPLADTSVWTRMVDGVLLVTRQGVTERRQLKRGLEAIEPRKLIGAMLNCSKHSASSDYYYRKPTIPALNTRQDD